ncbi:ASCH domain-containing protein [bacterium]|nr:ASCH domain-containing protein [bacterium]
MSVMVKAISLHQPWASAVALGAKRIETRHWCAPAWLIGQPLLIHAAKTQEWLGHEGLMRLCDRAMADAIAAAPALPPPGWLGRSAACLLPLGALVAVARLSACHPITMRNGVGTICLPGNAREDVSDMETALGNFEPGRFGWILSDVRPLPTPIPFRGQQGIFPVPADLLPEELRP